MFQILRQSISTGIVTTAFPAGQPVTSPNVRGKPAIDFSSLKHAPQAAAACPTGALACKDAPGQRRVSLDLAKCTFCGLCAEKSPAIRMTAEILLAARSRAALACTARYRLDAHGNQGQLLEQAPSKSEISAAPDPAQLAAELKHQIGRRFGRSLHIREVDAGSCNGCEVEIVGLNSPVYDLERFGIHFVASPRHADMLLVTGPVAVNMQLALRKTYDAMPGPRLVVAAGTCGCSGGIFGRNYATLGGVDQVVPVDVYVPGCPPHPCALLQGILMAVGRAGEENG